MKQIKTLLVALPFLFAGCQIEDAPELGQSTIKIASDYLESVDTIMFADIADSLHCRIEIINMNADQLIGEVRNKRFNTELDLIMMRSVYDVNRLKRQHVFHHLRSSELRNRWTDYDVVPFSIDPFAEVPRIDSLYYLPDSLGSGKTLIMIPQEDLITYLSYEYNHSDPIVITGRIKNEKDKFTRNVANQFQIKSAVVHQSDLNELMKDSVLSFMDWNKVQVLERYDVYTVGLMNQTENYHQSIEFIRLLRKEQFLEAFMDNKRSLPLPVNDGSLKLELEGNIQYFTQIERVLRTKD